MMLPFISLLPLLVPAIAQFVPTPSEGEEIRNPTNPDIVVRYKSPGPEICQTTNPNQKQYAGYVSLPPDTLGVVSQNYAINTFFWFVEARENPEEAPLTIWLNGGPGSSSLLGMLTEMGPCEVVPFGVNKLGTVPREYGWDGASNMIFLDQPNQVGYSYDEPEDGMLPLLDPNARYFPGEFAPPLDEQPLASNMTLKNQTAAGFLDSLWSLLLINGTFPSGNVSNTANTTQIAAVSAWHFLQSWLHAFPQYNPRSNGLNLFAESYGGKYGPQFFAYFEEQNQKREQGDLSEETVELHLESLGIVNGCIDVEIQAPSYAIFPNENPYGIKAVSDSQRQQMLESFESEGGCRDQIRTCRALRKKYDGMDLGANSTVNMACATASAECDAIRNVYAMANLSFYDIASPATDPFPSKYHLTWLNNATVQDAVGSPVNFTQSNYYVYEAFQSTGDLIRDGDVSDIAYLLKSGVRVALIYGDRDFICNYIGGEAVSLAVEYPSSEAFAAAGYQNITLSDSSVYGQVRQHGNFSFSRVYQAGHLVPSYQPEASYAIFERIINGKAIATGEDIQTSGDDVYSSEGTQYTNTTLTAPPPMEPTCWLREASTCDELQWIGLADREGVVINGIWYNSTEAYDGPKGNNSDVVGGSGSNQGTDTQGEGDAQNNGDVEGAAARTVMGADTVLVTALGAVVLGAITLW